LISLDMPPKREIGPIQQPPDRPDKRFAE